MSIGSVRLEDVEHHCLRGLVVRFESDQDGDFIPYVCKSFGVVGDWLGEHHTIGDVDQTTGRLFGVDPSTYLHQREPEQADINDVAFEAGYLNAVPNLEWLSTEDEGPSRNVLENVRKSDRYTSRDQSQVCRETAERVQPDERSRDDEEDGCCVIDDLPSPVLGVMAFDVAVEPPVSPRLARQKQRLGQQP